MWRMKILSKSLLDTERAGQEFLQTLVPPANIATVVELVGNLGSGKTTFTQYLAKSLGVEDFVVSPTFVIQKRYSISHHPQFKTLIHIDAYRLENPDDIQKLDWKRDIENPENLILVEWPENIKTHIPQSLQIQFTYIDETSREIEIVDRF